MKGILALAHIATDKGINASGVTVNLETYILSTKKWQKIASERTNTEGVWKAEVTALLQNDNYAPTLRLTEPGTPSPRVLSQGGLVSYKQDTDVLSVDFGHIERLEEMAYSLRASSSSFSRLKLIVAGYARKDNISITSTLRENAILRDSPILAAAPINAATLDRSAVLDNFDAEVLKFKANEANLRSKITQKESLIVARDLEIKGIKTKVSELELKLTRSIAVEKELEEKNRVFVEEAKRKMSIQDIATNIGNEVDEANKRLLKEKRPYQFGRIELDLRGTVSTDAQSMTLANLVDLKAVKNASLPSIKVELLPKHIPSEVVKGVIVPDVTNLTETAVRRLLSAVGLQLKVINRSVELTEKIPIGQSIQQSPAAGSELSRNEDVLVVFAASSINSQEII